MCSPILFAIAIDDLLQELDEKSESHGLKIPGSTRSICALAFADDICLLAGNKALAQELLNICEKFAESHGLQFHVAPIANKSKCKFMITGKVGGADDPWCNLTLHGQSLAETTSIKVLGVHISNMLGWPVPPTQLDPVDGSIRDPVLPTVGYTHEWPLLSENTKHPLVGTQTVIGDHTWECTRVRFLAGRRMASLVSYINPFRPKRVDISVRELWSWRNPPSPDSSSNWSKHISAKLKQLGFSLFTLKRAIHFGGVRLDQNVAFELYLQMCASPSSSTAVKYGTSRALMVAQSVRISNASTVTFHKRYRPLPTPTLTPITSYVSCIKCLSSTTSMRPVSTPVRAGSPKPLLA